MACLNDPLDDWGPIRILASRYPSAKYSYFKIPFHRVINLYDTWITWVPVKNGNGLLVGPRRLAGIISLNGWVLRVAIGRSSESCGRSGDFIMKGGDCGPGRRRRFCWGRGSERRQEREIFWHWKLLRSSSIACLLYALSLRDRIR